MVSAKRQPEAPIKLPPDIGLPSGAYWDLSLAGALERIADYATRAEVYSTEHHSLRLPQNRAAARESGLRLTVHGPYDHIWPGSRDERRRRAAVEMHRINLEAAADVGAGLYVVHPDFSERRRARNADVEAALQRTIADLAGLQRQTGVRVVIENMPGVGHSHYVRPGDLDLGELGLLLDTGHAAISECLDEFLRAPRATLTHVHLHSNAGPADADDPHLPLGRGIVDAAPVLAAARAAGATVILELMSDADVRESLAHLRERGLI